ncbi:MAG: hypothetical protein J7M29_10865 [Verrucomicrobia bacterium]|nr:hypothetical protein [Verrucomicrobiota bacterium]
MPEINPLQTELRPALPAAPGNVDCQRFETELKRIDELLRRSGIKALFVRLSLERRLHAGARRQPTPKEQTCFQ